MADNHLVKVSEQQLTITRRKYGRGFQYFRPTGEKLTCSKSLKRIKQLVIPPMWQDVRICELANGHIQAIGYDKKIRRQYIYHELWQRAQQQKKFMRLVEFAQRLPAMRRVCVELLGASKWSKEKLLALMVLILDETGIRIGNPRSASENSTYGLTTLRRKHLEIHGAHMAFSFQGKGNKARYVPVDDPILARHVRTCAAMPGYELFRYQDDSGTWHDIDSDDVNAFIDRHMGEAFSGKDFRTWAGTRQAYEVYPQALELKSQSPRKQLLNIVIKMVAEELGNTPTICRRYYIHPYILQLINEQALPLKEEQADPASPQSELSSAELTVLKLLQNARYDYAAGP